MHLILRSEDNVRNNERPLKNLWEALQRTSYCQVQTSIFQALILDSVMDHNWLPALILYIIDIIYYMYIYHNHIYIYIYIYNHIYIYIPKKIWGFIIPYWVYVNVYPSYCYVTHCLLLLSVAEIQQQLSRVTITVIVSI